MGLAAATKPSTRSIRWAGAACLIAGLLCAAGNVFLALLSPVGSGGFTFPHGAPEFIGVQMALALVRAGLIFGVLGLWWSGSLPSTGIARFGRHLALVMLAVLAATEGLIVSVPSSPLDGTPPVFGVVYAVYTLLLGIALLAMGAGVARGGQWRGWKRWLPSGLGVWLLMVVLPALALSFDAARWALSMWLVLFAVLGFVLLREKNALPISGGSRIARSAAVVTWVYAAAFGSPIIPNAAYILQNGRLPTFLDVFAMYGGPWSVPFDAGRMILLLIGFQIVMLAATWAAWLVWHGSRLGVVLSLALLPVEAAFWFGFSLPIPWLLGALRAALLIAAWRSLRRSRVSSAMRNPGPITPDRE